MRLTELPAPARFLVAALRAAARARARGVAWEDGELLALCDATGLRRDAAARLGACLVLLLREARCPPGLRPFGCATLSAAEGALVAAFAGLQAERPREAQRLLVAWLPARRRVQGMALLALSARDLAAARLRIEIATAGRGLSP